MKVGDIGAFCDALIAEGLRVGSPNLAWRPFTRRADVMAELERRGYWLGSDWDPFTRRVRYYAFPRESGSVS